MQIIESFIPKGRRNRPALKMRPRYLCLHDTGNPSYHADAEAHAAYLQTTTAANVPVSWHFTVDGGSIEKPPQIYQHLPLDENGWHAGDGTYGPGNRKSIGIEICMNTDGDRAKAEELAAKLVAYLIKTVDTLLPLPMTQHYDWNGKNCPRVLRGRPGGWQEFLDLVKEKQARPLPEISRWVEVVVRGEYIGPVGVLINQKTYVPLRFFGEKLGYNVDWRNEKAYID